MTDNQNSSKNSFSRIKNSIKFRLDKKLYNEQWFLICDFGSWNENKSFEKFKQIIPPKDRFWTDPHIVFKNNSYYIFFEELIFSEGKGHISFFRLESNGSHTQTEKILEEKFHISYPFIFEYEDNLYMIPETHENRTIQLYKSTDFPRKWKPYEILMKDVDAVDTTIIFYNNLWWMFTCLKSENNTSWNDLHIFYSKSPISNNWTSHPMNPIRSDSNNLRSGGNLFVDEGILYRTTQESTAEEYGKKIIINKIITLNENEFREEIFQIKNPWNDKILGMHTFNHLKNFKILDAKWKISR